MNRRAARRVFRPFAAATWIALAGPLFAAAGCQRVLRESVVATTQSMIGLSLAQNPASQSYELRAGYGRSEFFLVPTSKYVPHEGDEETAGAGAHPDPTGTPEVLAEIRIGGEAEPGAGGAPPAGGRISQRLAVGREAVRSGAAAALLAPTPDAAATAARIESTARAAEEAIALGRTAAGPGLAERAPARRPSRSDDAALSPAEVAELRELLRAFRLAPLEPASAKP